MENKWIERIAIAIVTAMLGLFVGSYTDIGKFSVRLRYLEKEIDTKIDNQILIEWLKRNKEDMKVIINDVKDNTIEIHKLREEMHEIELQAVGVNATRGYEDDIDWNYENLISFEWANYKELNNE